MTDAPTRVWEAQGRTVADGYVFALRATAEATEEDAPDALAAALALVPANLASVIHRVQTAIAERNEIRDSGDAGVQIEVTNEEHRRWKACVRITDGTRVRELEVVGPWHPDAIARRMHSFARVGGRVSADELRGALTAGGRVSAQRIFDAILWLRVRQQR